MNRLLALLAASIVMGAPRASGAAELRADTSASTFTIRVRKAGAFSAFGHDHAFSPARWRADARLDPDHPAGLRVDVEVEAASLHDHEHGLSEKDRASVDRQAAGREVLDAGRFREIRYQGAAGEDLHRAGDGSLEGVLHGTLTLHGVARPLDVPFHARPGRGGYLASAAVSFRQSAFGMKPYATAGGTIRVQDEVKAEIELVFQPAAGAAAARSMQHTTTGDEGHRSW